MRLLAQGRGGLLSPRVVLEVFRRLMGYIAGLIVLYGGLDVIPRVGATLASHPDGHRLESGLPYLLVFRDMAPWALGIMAAFALIHAAGGMFPSLGYVFRVPRKRLFGLAVLYFLLAERGIFSVAYGFEGSSSLFWAVAMVLAVSYGVDVGQRWSQTLNESRSRGTWLDRIRNCVDLIRVFEFLFFGAALAWGVLSTLPSISLFLLDHKETEKAGLETLPYFSAFFEVRYLLPGLWAACLTGWALPHVINVIRVTGAHALVTLLQAAALVAGAAIAWFTGGALASLGAGYPLAGAAIAAGLFLSALSILARSLPANRWRVLGEVAAWFAESRARPFFLGVSIAVYALLLRPVFYDRLLFAGIFEWLAIITLCAILFGKLQGRFSRVTSTGHLPPLWPNWSRHQQQVRDLPDAHFDEVISIQSQFVDYGRWDRIWIYFLGIMFANQTPLEAIHGVFQPLAESRRKHDLRLLLLYGWRLRVEAKRRTVRQGVLAAAMARLDTAMIMREGPPVPSIDSSQIRKAEKAFVEDGGSSGPLAVTLVLAKWQRGVDLATAAPQYLPLMAYVDRNDNLYWPPFLRRWSASRKKAWRRVMVENIDRDLFGEYADEAGTELIPLRVVL